MSLSAPVSDEIHQGLLDKFHVSKIYELVNLMEPAVVSNWAEADDWNANFGEIVAVVPA